MIKLGYPLELYENLNNPGFFGKSREEMRSTYDRLLNKVKEEQALKIQHMFRRYQSRHEAQSQIQVNPTQAIRLSNAETRILAATAAEARRKKPQQGQ